MNAPRFDATAGAPTVPVSSNGSGVTVPPAETSAPRVSFASDHATRDVPSVAAIAGDQRFPVAEIATSPAVVPSVVTRAPYTFAETPARPMKPRRKTTRYDEPSQATSRFESTF